MNFTLKNNYFSDNNLITGDAVSNKTNYGILANNFFKEYPQCPLFNPPEKSWKGSHPCVSKVLFCNKATLFYISINL